MREPKLIHGIDYLVDYYAVLDVDRNAGVEEITRAYKEQVSQWHPDVVARAAPKLQKEAQFKTEVLTEAYKVLIDTEKRTTYDEKLKAFDGPISKNGNPVIDLGRRRIDVDCLVSGAVWNEKEQVIGYAKQASGYDETIFNLVKKLYEANPEDKEAKKAYKEMLQKKNAYLSALESIAWEDAGVSNQHEPKKVFFSEDYVAARQEQVTEIGTAIAANIETRVNALATGEAPKLLTAGREYNAEDVKPDALALRQELTDIALNNLGNHRQEIMGMAAERANVLEELLKFTEWEYYPEGQELHEALFIVIADGGNVKAGMQYNLERGIVTPAVKKIEKKSVAELKADKAYVEQMLQSGVSVAILYMNPEVSIFMETAYVMNEHVARLKK